MLDPFNIAELFKDDGKTLVPEASAAWRELCLVHKTNQHRVSFSQIQGRGLSNADLGRVLRSLANEGFLKALPGPFGAHDSFQVNKEYRPVTNNRVA